MIKNRHNPAPVPDFTSILLYFCLLVLLAAGGCAKKMAAPYEPALEAQDAVAEQKMFRQAEIAADMEETPPATGPASRMIYYNGFIRLKATDPPAILKTAADRVIAIGGYVERMDQATATFRVPVARFQAVFDDFLQLGDVMNKSITAQDITESFQDIMLRLQIAEATRKRLVELLNKAADEKEKLTLLGEIHRLNDQIEQMTHQRDTLSALASFSRLTLEAHPRREVSVDKRLEDVRDLQWIHSLSPFSTQVAEQGEYLSFEVPGGMVPLEKKRLWVAESADGAVFRAHRRNNYPRGNTDFWFEAIRTRIAPEFMSSVSTVGGFKMLRLMSRTRAPYVYLVGVHVSDDRLELVEVYFPSTAQEERYWDSISKSIAGGAR